MWYISLLTCKYALLFKSHSERTLLAARIIVKARYLIKAFIPLFSLRSIGLLGYDESW